MRRSLLHRMNPSATPVISIALSLACSSTPEPQEVEQVEATGGSICRSQAKRECALDAGGLSLDDCISKRSWNCEMGQGSKGVRDRYSVPGSEGGAAEAAKETSVGPEADEGIPSGEADSTPLEPLGQSYDY
jgi:hypothetical protein